MMNVPDGNMDVKVYNEKMEQKYKLASFKYQHISRIYCAPERRKLSCYAANNGTVL